MNRLLLGILLFTSYTLAAQDEYLKGELYLSNGTIKSGYLQLPVITANTVSLKGREKIKFKENWSSKEFDKYFEKDVDSLVLSDGRFYEFIPIRNKRKTLCMLLSTGKQRLYSRYVANVSSHTISGASTHSSMVTMRTSTNYPQEFYALKEGASIASPLVKYGPLGVTFKRYAISYFKDCKSIVAKIRNKTYQKEDILEMISEYEGCE